MFFIQYNGVKQSNDAIVFCSPTKALNKIKQDVWQDSHHQVNLRPSTRVPFAEYIVKVKDVADAADFFYHPRHGMFDAMPACWKNLAEVQRREVAALIGSFYNESHAFPQKHPWSVSNLKKFLNLGYVNLVDMPKLGRLIWQLVETNQSLLTLLLMTPPLVLSPATILLHCLTIMMDLR